MIHYPIPFFTKVSAKAGMNSSWTVYSGNSETICCIPIEFEGPGGAFSPEDLFAQALTNCFVATFKVMAEKSKFSFDHLEVIGELIVDRDEQSRPVMKDFHLKISLAGVSNQERAYTLVKKSIENGFILNSVKTAIRYDVAL